MIIKGIKLKNYTVFDDQQLVFSPGINIFIGENGTGKTHLLKLLYSACQSADPGISFARKIVGTMLPDDYKISRLLTRKQGNHSAFVRIQGENSDTGKERTLTLKFHGKTRKWDAEVTGEEGWEEAFQSGSSVFIPAKEILSHSFNLNAAAEKNNVRFDDTYLDIINAAKVDVSAGRDSIERSGTLQGIEKMIHGTVYYDVRKDEFYLKSGYSKQEFNLVAEGVCKMGLLWQLVKNGTLDKGAVLFWDEPEANMNPANIEEIVGMILQLQRRGVQVFISTHDYMLASFFEVKKNQKDRILFHSLERPAQNQGGCCEQSERFSDLKNNSIVKAFDHLLNEIYNMEV